MTDTQKYWITDSEGVYAQVEGADQLALWTRVRGWAEAGEPGPTDQVWVVNEHPEVGPGRMPYAAVALHAGLGWSAGPPFGDFGPAPEPPAKTTKAPAPAGDKKE